MIKNDLTQGSINKKLVGLAFPIMGTSFLQMAYNLIDMIWIGRLGADAVAAVGTAGFFMWFSFSLVTLSRTGVEVKVAQALGLKKTAEANKYLSTGFVFAVLLGILYGLALGIFKEDLIGFFKLNSIPVESMAHGYLLIVAFSMPFTLINQIISAVYNASGNSRVPFIINGAGLLMNMALDPLFIWHFKMGASGAAIATTVSQIFVTALMFVVINGNKKPYEGFLMGVGFHRKYFLAMFMIALPVALQNGLFTIISMFVARIVAIHGTTAVAVQKVGTQIEAITYMTAHGFGAALSAFTGQNIGAKNTKRVRSGFLSAGVIMGLFGLFTSVLLYVGAEPIFRLFIKEQPALTMGVVYLRIISLSQMFMCLEITLAGGFNGLGKSTPPAIIGVTFNALRIPFSYILSTYTILGLNGIWWSISVSSMFKGVVLIIVLLAIIKKSISDQVDAVG